MTTESPGTASSTSAGRDTGRALRSWPVTVIWLAVVGAIAAPPATFGAPATSGGGGGAGGCGGAAAHACAGLARAPRVLARLARTSMVGSCTPLAGVVGCGDGGVWADA